jgi:hypothetical protein
VKLQESKAEDKSVTDDEIKREVSHQEEEVLGVGVTPSVDQLQ